MTITHENFLVSPSQFSSPKSITFLKLFNIDFPVLETYINDIQMLSCLASFIYSVFIVYVYATVYPFSHGN